VEGCRAAGDHDLARIVELAVAMRAELSAMKGGAMWLQREGQREPLEASYRELLSGDDAQVVVGTIDDVVLGFGVAVVQALPSGTSLGVITDLFVEQEAREVGIGEQMITDLLTFCRDRGCVGIDAFALPGHRAAKNFFEEQHFTARLLTMHRPLDPSS
jgi:GNAT superfamily N-acetyltransferase